MPEVKHTPGPWTAVHDADGDYAIFAGDKLLAVTHADTEEDAANARLIAAAPELESTLEEAPQPPVINWDLRAPAWSREKLDEFAILYALWWRKRTAAIAKATGQLEKVSA